MKRMTSRSGRPLIFGEVLFDEFPDGSVVLGGAPFNVAWHLRGFGGDPLFLSRVGRDGLGEQVIDTLRGFSMDARGVQLDAQRPTGRVKVSFEAGQPSFAIVPDQAYDFIDAQQAVAALAGVQPALLYHGSLATRQETSRECLSQIRSRENLPVFIDVNLRDPWWDPTRIDALMRGARWAKLNDVELAQLTGNTAMDDVAQISAAQAYRARYGLEMLIVTRGAQGARLLTEDEHVYMPAPPVTDLVDTVGAGDAFSAVMLHGITQAWSMTDTLQRALEFAAAVCRQRGATQSDYTWYDRFVKAWNV